MNRQMIVAMESKMIQLKRRNRGAMGIFKRLAQSTSAEIVTPMKVLPVSPMTMRAGDKLKKKKPKVLPARAKVSFAGRV